jgi:hypothetical protein
MSSLKVDPAMVVKPEAGGSAREGTRISKGLILK